MAAAAAGVAKIQHKDAPRKQTRIAGQEPIDLAEAMVRL